MSSKLPAVKRASKGAAAGEEVSMNQNKGPRINIDAQAMYGFVQEFLLETYDESAPIPDFHLDMWGEFCSPDQQVALAAPRRHAKTTAGSEAWGLAMLLFKCVDFAVIGSNVEGQAIGILGNMKMQIQHNDKLRLLYPNMRIIKDTQTDFICELDSDWQFRVVAKGWKQTFRGTKWGSKRPNLVLIDDFEDPEEVLSKEIREKMKAKFMSDIMLCGSRNCLFRVVGTILHEDSLLEGLLNSPSWRSKRYRAHNEDFTKILFPGMYNEEYFRRLMAQYAADGILDQYYREMLSTAIARGDTLFNEADFIPMTDDDFDKAMMIYVTIDFAISEKQKADFTVFLVFGICSQGYIYILHIEDFRMKAEQPLRIQETFFSINGVFEPEMFIAEAEKIDKAIKPYLHVEMASRARRGEKNAYFQFESIPSTTSKVQRSTAMQARMSARHVRWNAQAEWFGRAKHQIMQATPAGVKAKHDDIFDAFSMIGAVMDKFYHGMSKEEIEEEEIQAYEEELEGILTEYGEMMDTETGY